MGRRTRQSHLHPDNLCARQKVDPRLLLGSTMVVCGSTAVSLLGNDNTARPDAMTSTLNKHLGSGAFKEEMKHWLKSRMQRDFGFASASLQIWAIKPSPPQPC